MTSSWWKGGWPFKGGGGGGREKEEVSKAKATSAAAAPWLRSPPQLPGQPPPTETAAAQAAQAVAQGDNDAAREVITPLQAGRVMVGAIGGKPSPAHAVGYELRHPLFFGWWYAVWESMPVWVFMILLILISLLLLLLSVFKRTPYMSLVYRSLMPLQQPDNAATIQMSMVVPPFVAAALPGIGIRFNRLYTSPSDAAVMSAAPHHQDPPPSPGPPPQQQLQQQQRSAAPPLRLGPIDPNNRAQ